ncbi:MAG TPA: nucleotide exchange factor GrpE, partial [Blastocatellia bacterium]|nr:nucleotide exchange factor GrpE [Blastocatellia bacterium]
MEDSLRRLRSRQLMMEAIYGGASPSGASPSPIVESPAETGEAQIEEQIEEQVEIEEPEEPAYDFDAAFDDVRQEIRRLGRELFKTNRTAESNQESFNEALTEIRQLADVVAQIPEQSAEAVREARFEAKAAVCRDLLRLADTAQASLSAADELIARLRQQADQPTSGFAFRFEAARRMRDSLTEAVAAMRQWRDGQALLAGRVEAILQAAGARAMDTVGRAFDPALHRAVSTEARRDVAAGTIVGEELKGYTLEGRI